MPKKLEHKIVNSKSLLDLFSEGISGVAICKRNNERPDSVWLVVDGEKVIKVTSIVSSVDTWDEMGSLVFELLETDSIPQKVVSLDASWRKIKSIEKLVFRDGSVCAESGIALSNTQGDEIVVVSSSFPYSVEFWSDFHPDDFEPECDLSTYARHPIIKL